MVLLFLIGCINWPGYYFVFNYYSKDVMLLHDSMMLTLFIFILSKPNNGIEFRRPLKLRGNLVKLRGNFIFIIKLILSFWLVLIILLRYQPEIKKLILNLMTDPILVWPSSFLWFLTLAEFLKKYYIPCTKELKNTKEKR